MPAEEINVPIVTKYDDKGAKEAIQDAEKIDKLHPTVDMSASEKSVGGFKNKIGEVSDALGGIASPLAAGAAAGAVAKFATDSMAAFGELGAQVEKFSEVAGVANDEASRWVAVADDYGVSAETLSGAVGKLGKTLGANADALSAYGVEVAKTKDGATDLSQTTLNVVDAYNKTTDPAKKAALATAAFGKSYQALIPLIDEGSASIKASFDDVSKAQLFDPAKVKEAKDYRLAMDDLHDAVRDLQLELGRELIPVLVQTSHAVTDVTGPLTDLIDKLPTGAVHGLTNALLGSLNPLVGGKMLWEGLTDRWDKAFGSADDLTKKQQELNQASVASAEGMALLGAATDAAARSTADAAQETQYAIDAAQNQYDADKQVEDAKTALAAATDSYVKSLQGEIDAATNAADASIAAADAHDKLTEATDKTIEAKKKHGVKSQEFTDAVKGERDAIIDASKAHERLADQQAATTGTTRSATDKVDSYNASLEENAKTATPAARQAAYDYLIQLNQIPPDKATEIQALVAQGKLDEANAEINNVSRTRQSAVEVTANTAQAEADIKKLIQTRNMQINAEIIAKGGAGYAQPGQGTGPRSVNPGPGPAPAPSVVVNLPRGANGVDVVRAIAGQTRRNGRRYGAGVVHFARQ